MTYSSTSNTVFIEPYCIFCKEPTSYVETRKFSESSSSSYTLSGTRYTTTSTRSFTCPFPTHPDCLKQFEQERQRGKLFGGAIAGAAFVIAILFFVIALVGGGPLFESVCGTATCTFLPGAGLGLLVRQHFDKKVAKKLEGVVTQYYERHVQASAPEAAPGSDQQTLVVAEAGGGDCRRIDDAIAKAQVGARILVRPGKYSGPVIVNKPVEIIGDGAMKEVVIDDNVRLQTSAATLRGLTIEAPTGVEVVFGQHLIEDCHLPVGNVSLNGPMAEAVVRRCIITGSSGSGVSIDGKSRAVVDDCQISRHGYQGVFIGSGCQGLVRRCRLHDMTRFGISVYVDATATIEDCEIFANTVSGVIVDRGGVATLQGVKSHDNTECGVLVINGGQATLTGCDIYVNALAGVESRANGLISLQGCKIHDGKQGGVYFNENGRGSVEDCDLYGNGLAGVEVKEGATPELRKCRLYDGKQNGLYFHKSCQGSAEDCDIYGNGLAGVAIATGAAPILRKCRVHDGQQGGIFVYEGGLGSIEDCDIFANAASNVIIQENGNPTLRNCQIHDGKTGGVFIPKQGQGTLEDCQIFKNGRAGVEIRDGSTPTLRRCQVYQGQKDGLVVGEGGQGDAEACQIIDNALNGVYVCKGGNANLRQCEIDRNGEYGIEVSESSAVTVSDCTLSENSKGAWKVDPDSQLHQAGKIAIAEKSQAVSPGEQPAAPAAPLSAEANQPAMAANLPLTHGLRPLGNKGRLTHTPGEDDYNVRLLLFQDRPSAEKYYQLLTSYARSTPPPYLIEIMAAYIPKTIFAEKYAVVIPNENSDTRPGYQDWVRNAIWTCNDTLRLHNSTDHKYKDIHKYLEVVYEWDILPTQGFSRQSDEAGELLRDDAGYPALKVLGQEGVAAPPEKPSPAGPWVGVLFEIAKFEEAWYSRAANKLLFEIVGKDLLTNSILHGGDLLPDCRYWCTAIHTASAEQAQAIQERVNAASEEHLAPPQTRILHGAQIPLDTLPYQGFVAGSGEYVGV
jgi:parallel beta-helix repeat protein